MFQNIDKFQKWLEEHLNTSVYDFPEFLRDIEDQHDSSGSCVYELGSFFTKSGHHEQYVYSVEYKEVEDTTVTIFIL